MKQIQPVQIWTAQGTKTAEYFDARIVADDLETSATFYWNINAADESNNPSQQLAEGNVSMAGEDYSSWDGSNQDAYEYVAGKIGVVIVA